jgi:rifampicin phosphotransferase
MTFPDVRSKDDPLYVLPLHAPQAGDSFTVGTKAANLSRLLTAGFPVPAGIVLTTAAFEYCTSKTDDDREAIQNQPLPKSVEDSLKKALASLGDAPLAVRSSGIAEDLAGASFAGQYETILDVVGFPAILDAIQKCWASAFSRQVRAYQSGHDIAEERMAVLIQPLVKADAAGVVFTANPVTCDRNEIVVSAVRGLGARLVSGEASPDEWLVRNGKAVCRCAPEGALKEEDVLAVAELARKVEEHFGTPQDIEWALCDGQLYLLQARPISTLRFGETQVTLPAEPPPGFWERASSHYPHPLFPLTR